MRGFNIYHILVIEYLCITSSYLSSSIRILQPRSLALAGSKGGSAGEKAVGASKSGEGLSHFGDVGTFTTQKPMSIEDIHSIPDPATTSPGTRLKPKLALGKEAGISGIPVTPPVLNQFDLNVDAPLGVPTERQKKLYDQRKIGVIRGLYEREHGIDLGNGQFYNEQNLGQMLEEKIPLTGERRKPEGYYDPYLKDLRQWAQAESKIGKAQKALIKLERTIVGREIPGEEEATKAINKLLEQLDQPKLRKFQTEYETALLSLQPTKISIDNNPAISEYFPNLLKKGAINVKELARARAIQLTPKLGPEEPAKRVFSTVEEVIHTLPADLDLTSEVYRYSLLKGFESYVSHEVRPQVMKPLAEKAGKQMTNFHKSRSRELFYIDRYINQLGEAEFQRWFLEKPTTVFQRLSRNPLDSEKIAHALQKHIQSLSPEDYEVLKAASDNRRVFRNAIKTIRERISATEDPKNVEYLEALKRLEKEAINLNPNNYPYVEELFKRGVIDESTRAKLNPAHEMTKNQFMETLGRQEDFSKDLMSRFKANLFDHISNGRAQDTDSVIARAQDLLTKSYMDNIDKEAKAFYLTKDAFEQPKAMGFEKAMQVYSREINWRTFDQPDRDAFVKAYVEAHIPPAGVPRSGMETFLDEVHMEGLFPKLKVDGGPISKLLPDMNERFAEFLEKPLTRGDQRLKGTRWETLSDKSLLELNNAAKDIFEDYDGLNKAAWNHGVLSQSIKKFEEENIEKIPRISELFEKLLENAKSPRQPPPIPMSEEGIAQINKAYRYRHSWFKRMQNYMLDKLLHP
ncbi:hypothetical protein MJO29_002954 [Puccinia striiformis f. sp. tritici]|nr:hypothetical protein Pst134EB_006219 [Puccinia striiformis f. sp. tritici]KAI7964856.1 hypothetical protein MJO29_002954 [Puccinia striiformis f. sp. tritici]